MSAGRNLTGVDIGSSAIKVCEIKEGRGGTRTLVRFGYHRLPPEAIVNGEFIDRGAIIEGLTKLFDKSKHRDVALRASGHSVIIKKIVMPLMTPQELDEQINWEAEQHIPFDLADVYVDHQVLRRREDAGQMDVLLVAAKKEEITELTDLAVEAKLHPKVVDLDAFAVHNVFEVAYGAPAPDQTIVLAHVGASLTTLHVLADGTTAFTRDIANGGNAATDEIQRQLGISRDDAETHKCAFASQSLEQPYRGPPGVQEILNQSVAALAGEIQRSLDFYLATSGDREISRVYLSGGGANLQVLQQAVTQRARVPVERIDPMRLVTPEMKIDVGLFQQRAAQAVVALGLSLRKDREKNA